MLTVFLGAGFSAAGGVPSAAGLFERKPLVDRLTRRRLVDRVYGGWAAWHEVHEGQPEEYPAHLKAKGGTQWVEAVWYVGLAVALATSRVQWVGSRPTVTRHNLNRTTGIPAHEDFGSSMFRRTEDVAVVTTNYDILPERGLCHERRPRVPRPGFNCGAGAEPLAGGGYPSYAHIQKIQVTGAVPLLKLHGSVSWSLGEQGLVRYHDCRPAVRGDPAIIAPVTTKELPRAFHPIWEAAGSSLSSSGVWVVVGYSLPDYDLLVRDLLRHNSHHRPDVHVFNPDPEPARRCAKCMPGTSIRQHPGLPDGLGDLDELMASIPAQVGDNVRR